MNGKLGEYWKIKKVDGTRAFVSLYKTKDERNHSLNDFIGTLTFDYGKELSIEEFYNEISKSDIQSKRVEDAVYEVSEIDTADFKVIKEAVYGNVECNEFANGTAV